jgi:lysozyme
VRKINAPGLALVREFEGCRLVAYDDLDPDRVLRKGDRLRGTLTIGHGHTGPDVVIGQRITAEAAARLLAADLGEAEQGVATTVRVPLSGNEFAALVSLAFNIGCRSFARSTLLRRLNAGDRLGAAAEFARWNRAGGKVLPGLVRRRAAEAALFLQAEGGTDRAAAHPATKPTETPDGVAAETKKSWPEIALANAPAVGAALGGVPWPVVLILVAGGLAAGWYFSRRSHA